MVARRDSMVEVQVMRERLAAMRREGEEVVERRERMLIEMEEAIARVRRLEKDEQASGRKVPESDFVMGRLRDDAAAMATRLEELNIAAARLKGWIRTVGYS